jgi:glycogen operon protein
VFEDTEPERQRLSLTQVLRSAKRAWHGVKLGRPDWAVSSHSLAFSAETQHDQLLVHVILNAYWEPLDFELAPLSGSDPLWRRWVDTSLESPDDILEWDAARPVPGRVYRAGPRSVAALFARV